LQNAFSRRRTWNAHNGQPRQKWDAIIVSCLHISVSRCRTVLPQSYVACTHQSSNVGRGLSVSSVSCTHRLADVERVLPESSAACAHRCSEVRRGLPASFVACTC